MRLIASWLTPLVALLVYLAFWPVPAVPVAWQAPKDLGYVGAHAVNQKLASLRRMELGPGQQGPEHITFHQGWLYTGLLNGDVLKVGLDGKTRELVANTGGRPLGIDVDAQGRVLVADGLKGLLRIEGSGPSAKVETLLTMVDDPVAGDPLRYADAVKVGPGGTVWLTDATRRFSVSEWKSTFEASVLDILEHSCTGRLIAVDPVSMKSRVALSGLCFPNGVAFSADGKSMFLSETASYRILKLDLAKLSVTRPTQGMTGTPTLANALGQGAATVLLDNLPGYPDNLMAGASGRIWVGLTKPRSPVVDMAAERPFIRSLTLRLPRFLWPVPKEYGHIIAFDESGKVVDDLQDPSGAYPETTAATEVDGKLFIQSLNAPSIGWRNYTGPAAR
ncbi:SMP-30/gluconolactonase/LRE family protein [Aquabacterium sp.]|uniref:SMP-30/gluconolactonase/LRE family protein n=1 Tax=Aquabacterium sp. TaxID=1872578 RepID=UPI003D6CB398